MSDFDEAKLRRLDLGLLLVFQEIFRKRRAAAAAERLGLTQPAISHALGRLRDVTGDPLFVRRPEGMIPTAFSSDIAPKIDAILALAVEAFGASAGFRADASRRLFKVSANDFVGSLLAAPLIERMAIVAPGARLSMGFAGGPAAAYRSLRSGELDIAIGRFLDAPDDCLVTRLFEEDYVVLARKGRSELNDLDLGTYAEQQHIVVSFAGDLSGSLDQHLASRGVIRRVAAAVPMFLAAFATAASSDLLVTAPRRLASRFSRQFGLQTYESPVELPGFAVDLLQARASVADDGAIWLVEQIRDVLAVDSDEVSHRFRRKPATCSE